MTPLDDQWNDFIHRLKQLIDSLPQCKTSYSYHIRSSLSDTRDNHDKDQEHSIRKENSSSELLKVEKLKHLELDNMIEDIQLDRKVDENYIEKVNKNLDGRFNIFSFLFM